MKRLMRVLARGVLGLGLLAVALGVATLDTVDWTPFFQQPAHAETARRVREVVAVRPDSGALSAGFGRAKLSPPLWGEGAAVGQVPFRAVPLAGYGARRGRPATGVHDEVEAKAVALRVAGRTVVFVGVDALIVPPHVVEQVMRGLGSAPGLTRAQVYFGATHTHAGLGGWAEGPVGEAFAGPYVPGAAEWFAGQITAAVRSALADLRPASLGQGRVAAPEFVRNRLVGELGRVDADFSYAVVRQEGGRTGVLGSYAAHATVLGSDVMEFSGDYPGHWQRTIEAATGGVAVFLAGAVGSHGPAAGGKGHAGAERMGRALAERVLERLPATALAGNVTLGVAAVDVVLPPLQVRVTDGLRLRPWLASRLLPWNGPAPVQAVRINDAVWLSTPCDFSGELALGVKEFLRGRGAEAVVTSFNGGYIGYVVSPRYYHLDSYETRRMSFFGPGVPDYLDDTLRALATGLLAP
jgi:neutral ceramidase